MGVDARMKLITTKPLSNDQVKDLAWKLGGAFFREGFYFYDNLQALTQNKELPCEVNVNISGRYYGPEYERGDITFYIAVADWLEANIPRCSVLYGNDSDERFVAFDEATRKQFKFHFHQHGHLPYVGFFDSEKQRPHCPRCLHSMISNGGGGNQVFLFCYGCPTKAILCGDKIHYHEEEHFNVADKLRKGELQYQSI